MSKTIPAFIQKLASLPDNVSETEVRTKLAIPIFQELGYSDSHRAEEFPTYANSGRTLLPPKPVDFLFFDSSDFNIHRTREERNWVQDHSLIAVELKKPTESIHAEGQAQFYAQWAKTPFYAITNGKELLVYRIEPHGQDILEIQSSIQELPKKWNKLQRLLNPRAVKRYIEENKLRTQMLHTTDYSAYTKSRKQLLEDSLIHSIPRMLQIETQPSNLSLLFSSDPPFEERSSSPIPLTSILSNTKFVVISAGLGGGKSHLIDFLTREILEHPDIYRNNNNEETVPIILLAKLWTVKVGSLVTWIWQELQSYVSGGLTEEMVEEDLNNLRFAQNLDSWQNIG